MAADPSSQGIDFEAPPMRAPRISLAYLLGVLVVSFVMVVLPLVYVALIGAVSFGVAFHAVHNVGILTGGGLSVLRLLVYATPIVAGGVLVLFMVKPLFARRVEDPGERVLRRDDEPVLHGFIEGICRAVGAPFPARIQVNSMINASAGGHVSLVTRSRRKLTLTIGLPLVGGLTTRQFAGVLAHEFGHFSQQAGMRLSRTIWAVNHWFARVVYERDHWDRELLEHCESRSGYVQILAQSSRLAVWLSRRLLVVLMQVGHVVSCFLMRQMEFHADSFEARLVGASTFAATVRRVRVLEAGNMMARAQLSQSWGERRLADDVPALVVAHADALPPELRRSIEKSIAGGRTGLFDTHPCDLERITRVSEQTRPASIGGEGPAGSLFRDFPRLCRAVTMDHYSRAVEERVSGENLVPTAVFLAAHAAVRKKQEAGVRYFQGLLTTLRPLFLEAHETPRATPDQTVQSLVAARHRFDKGVAEGLKALRAFERADRIRIQALQAERLLAAGMAITAQSFDLPSGDLQGVERARSRAASLERESLPVLEHVEEALRERFMASLEELRHASISDRIPEGLRKAARFDALLDTLAALKRSDAEAGELRNSCAWLGALVRCLQAPGAGPDVPTALEAGARRLLDPLSRARRSLDASRYPFDHASGPVSLGLFLLPEIPSIRDTGGLFTATTRFLKARSDLYLRIMTELGAIAEEVERLVGLEPPAMMPGDPCE